MFSKIAHRLTDYDNPDSYASKLREKRLSSLILIIEKVFKEKSRVNILDMGGTRRYWNIVPSALLEKYNVHITMVNFESELGVESGEERFNYVIGDCCNLNEITENQYDIAHSNSVIEHVGSWHNMKLFAQEALRSAHYIYLQTPNFWFPIEPHCMVPFYHWLPRLLKIRLLMYIAVGKWKKCSSLDSAIMAVDGAQLLTYSMLRELFPNNNISSEKYFLLNKSFIVT